MNASMPAAISLSAFLALVTLQPASCSSICPNSAQWTPSRPAALAGLALVTRQSGNWKGKSFIQGGRATLRQALYIPALVAIRFNPPLKAKYLALRATGKSAKLAIVAIMRKLHIIANALLRDNRKWTLEIA
jgi:transposase